MKKTTFAACVFGILLSSILFSPQQSFAVNSLQDGLWDFDYVGIIVSDNQLTVGQEMEIQIPVFNTGQEAGSVLVSINLQDSSGARYYGETKIFDIPPLSKDYPSAKFYFVPEIPGQHSVNVVIHTPDAAHVFDTSPSGLFLNALDVGQTNDQPGVAITKLIAEPSTVVENIPQQISAQAAPSPVSSPPVVNVDSSKISQLESELATVKSELVNIKKDMAIKSVDNNILLFIIVGSAVALAAYLSYKNRKAIKAVMTLLVDHYKQPIPAK